ncbi:MAG: Phosphoenolpyruvate synthase [Candidatus Nomurabacteria bacterium]|nr:Phosphoenolpyruvate synthase [Candidatus Nomurabacteria bacterium]
MSNLQEYRYIMNRSLSLIACELWDKGERLMMPEKLAQKIFFDPLFIYRMNKAVTIYYNFTDPKQSLNSVAQYLNENESIFDELKDQFDVDCYEIRQMIDRKKPEEFNNLFEKVICIWPLIAISNVLGDDRDYLPIVKESMREKYLLIRKESDGLWQKGAKILQIQAEHLIPQKYLPWSEFLLSKEVISKELPSITELKKRKDGYLYHKGSLYVNETTEIYLKDNQYFLTENEKPSAEVKIIKGISAMKGKVIGKVKVIFEKKDIKKIEKGDILVTPMTSPNLIEAMNRAAGFVTDEGGVTCHAAIIAREMGKPCIIATKIATKVLNDGDLVEVDADSGRVIKL